MTDRLLSPEAYEAHQARVRAWRNAAPAPAAPEPPRDVTLVVPYPVGVAGNHYWVPGPNGSRILSKEARAYRRTVAQVVDGMRAPTLYGRLSVTAHIAPPDRRERDLDNVWKAVGDALQFAGLYQTDGAIDELHLIRIAARRDCGVVVTLRVIRP